MARTSARQVAERLGIDPGTAADALRRAAPAWPGDVSSGRQGRRAASVCRSTNFGPVAGLSVVQPCTAEPCHGVAVDGCSRAWLNPLAVVAVRGRPGVGCGDVRGRRRSPRPPAAISGRTRQRLGSVRLAVRPDCRRARLRLGHPTSARDGPGRSRRSPCSVPGRRRSISGRCRRDGAGGLPPRRGGRCLCWVGLVGETVVVVAGVMVVGVVVWWWMVMGLVGGGGSVDGDGVDERGVS